MLAPDRLALVSSTRSVMPGRVTTPASLDASMFVARSTSPRPVPPL